MGVKEVLERALRTFGAKVSGLRRLLPGGLPGSSASSPFGEGAGKEDRDADIPAESGIPGANGAFPGFAPVPSLAERLRGGLESMVGQIRDNPRALLAATGGLLAALALAVAAVLAFRPPKAVTKLPPSDAAALEILRRIPVPLDDPLDEDSPLDRPRKDRYTESEIARRWIDLGRLPTEELRKANWEELQNLLSAREKP